MIKEKTQNDGTHFTHLFWFCVGVFVLSFFAMMALLFIEIPDANREMASNAQGFLQGSLITSAVGFLLTGSITTTNKKIPDLPPGSTTADISATITTNNTDQPKI